MSDDNNSNTTVKKVFERRDPYSPMLMLGQTFSVAGIQNITGLVEVYDDNDNRKVSLVNGQIHSVFGTNGINDIEQGSSLFGMDRPRVRWLSDYCNSPNTLHRPLDPGHMIVKGITDQKDKFDPVLINDRIPVKTLQIEHAAIPFLKQLPLSKDVFSFFNNLTKPTPISMILWKRGLSPEHAGALLVALNLLGVWRNQWKPGYLPKISNASKVIKKAESGISDYSLLGVTTDSTPIEQDRAYRKLALLFHPDRALQQSRDEKALSLQAFGIISDAYNRLKVNRTSRRKLKIRSGDNSWQTALESAENAAANNNIRLAKKFAITALSMGVPSFIKPRLNAILIKNCANF